MSIAVQCRQCNGRFSAPDRAIGKTAHCPKCGQEISVQPPTDFEQPPIIEVAPSPLPKTESAAFSQMVAESLRNFPRKRALVISCTIAFLATLRTDSRLGTLLHYAALITVLCSFAALIASRLNHRLAWYALAPLIGALAWLWGHFDYKISYWTDTTDTGAEWQYTDYTYCGKARPYYRKMWTSGTANDGLIHLSIEGGFSQTGKLHGRWHTWAMYSADSGMAIGDRHTDKDEWYWYGEEITEGEWHLRNR